MTITPTIQQSLAAAGDTNPNKHPIQYMDTVDAYNKWAEIYDTDGNFLQALDTLELRTLLPAFLHRVEDTTATIANKTLIDLGCGTGRNTLHLMHHAPPTSQIIGLDASPGMLDVARKRIAEVDPDAGTGSAPRVRLAVLDLLTPDPGVLASASADGMISTLVLEHVPLDQFFMAVTALLKPGGYLLLTNMHAEMGAISQAGFVDPGSGRKIRPVSYSYGVAEVVRVAGENGLEVVDLDGEEKVRERRVDEGMVGVLGERARKWVGVVVWFGVCFRRI
ncbi:class I SAM-dependent DNA methyltransferase [Aspergillus candidus]|uniref:S-adenosyl-L-methionine-dependent methyltransferase n=1 Tax=Aspergillus candidus TaxID=41067 RepID=A0A2I2F328_ASPCN|nr:S-adenosyl-L-methionine-dependent methyltransferase [Aspergillus candidus]PLB35019.1 S-adenosyl-L-methionine-dependent methyltransferase [Aspergillus candidus]